MSNTLQRLYTAKSYYFMSESIKWRVQYRLGSKTMKQQPQHPAAFALKVWTRAVEERIEHRDVLKVEVRLVK